ncbi:hypothetical protein NIZ92_11565 [Alcaligenes sp. 1735tsa3]|uniref:hypothetical protein n=1 Tax=Alcaligenes sp. 1735tsa3 TaxID=2953809 RepID=UPI0020A7C503|nr:hypothetical protein [Alcaligenes sp. 1735tsa3]USY23960.1 hypothetical protein NIZ92_11565 [Alcaligenes sp. 1735tsa3]
MSTTKVKLTAESTAKLLLTNAHLYSEEKGKEVSRFRVSKASVRRISGYGNLSPKFLGSLKEELLELNWLLFDLTDAEFGVFLIAKAGSWVRLGSNRVMAYRRSDSPEATIAELFDECFPPEEVEDIDD